MQCKFRNGDTERIKQQRRCKKSMDCFLSRLKFLSCKSPSVRVKDKRCKINTGGLATGRQELSSGPLGGPPAHPSQHAITFACRHALIGISTLQFFIYFPLHTGLPTTEYLSNARMLLLWCLHTFKLPMSMTCSRKHPLQLNTY
jgi:hypothetical protein